MNETKEDSVDGNSDKQSSDDSFHWDEWTVIDGQDNLKNRTTSELDESKPLPEAVSETESENASDAEEARECVQVLSEKMPKQCPNVENSEESVDHQNEESDGVSVITESDVDEVAGGVANGREVVVYENVVRGPTADRPDADVVRTSMPVMKVLNVMIACSLVAVIGIGAGRVLNVDENSPISTELDLVAMKMESSRLREQMNELSGVKEILQEIKASILQERISDLSNLRDETENSGQKLPYLKKQFKTLDSSFNKPDSTVSERLQIFLRTICLVLEDIRQTNANAENLRSTCDTHSQFSELKNVHALLNSAIEDMEPSEKSTHQRFLRNVEFRMHAMSDSVITDLTRTLDKLRVKNRNKLEKMTFKLNERLCVIRNTLPSDSKVRKNLENNNTFIDNCDDIAMKKSNEWSNEKSIKRSATVETPKFNDRPDTANANFKQKSRNPRIKRQNATSSNDTAEKRKCYPDKLSSFAQDSRDSDDTCALLMAPPRFDWKSKHKAPKMRSTEEQKYQRKKMVDEWPGKLLLKGDKEASKIWKKKTKELNNSKLRKSGVSSWDKDDNETTKRIKDRSNGKTRTGSVLSEPPITKPDGKYKKAYPSSPIGQRSKKNVDKEKKDFIVLERRDDDSKVEGNWQFERRSYRSRIRDQLRNDDSTGNWYFDRVENRKNSRMNCDVENRHPKCGTLRP